MFGGANHQIAAVAGGFFQPQNMFWRNFDARQHFAQRLPATFALNREYDRAGKGFKETAQIVQRRFVLRLYREVWQLLITEVNVGGFLGQTFRF